MIVDAASVRDTTANEDEEEEEPATEDEEPATEDDEEDAPLPAAREQTPSVPAIEALMAEARRFVENSFSSGGYRMANERLKEARDMAQQVGSGCHCLVGAASSLTRALTQLHAEATYNSSLRSLVSAVQKQPKKRDYLPKMRADALGLLVGGGTSAAEAKQFEDELKN